MKVWIKEYNNKKFKSRSDTTEERISKLKDKSAESV